MVLICANLKKRDLVAFADFQTSFLELFIHIGRKDHSSIFGWADDMVQKN